MSYVDMLYMCCCACLGLWLSTVWGERCSCTWLNHLNRSKKARHTSGFWILNPCCALTKLPKGKTWAKNDKPIKPDGVDEPLQKLAVCFGLFGFPTLWPTLGLVPWFLTSCAAQGHPGSLKKRCRVCRGWFGLFGRREQVIWDPFAGPVWGLGPPRIPAGNPTIWWFLMNSSIYLVLWGGDRKSNPGFFFVDVYS